MKSFLLAISLFLFPFLGQAESQADEVADPVIFTCEVQDTLSGAIETVEIKNTDVQYAFPLNVGMLNGHEIVLSGRINRSAFDDDGFLHRALTLKIDVRDQDHDLLESAAREISENTESLQPEIFQTAQADISCTYHALKLRIQPSDSF